jgi:hypothetical protein
MDEDLTRSIVLWLWGGILGGLLAAGLVGFVWRWVGKASDAMGIGATVFFVVLSVGAGGATWIATSAALERRSGTVPALGELLRFETQRLYDNRNRRTTTVEAPRVAFTTSEGRRVEFTALGGSLKGREPGDAVRVRYRPEKPEQAIVDDFQHQWGAAWGMGAFAGFGLAGAVGCLSWVAGELRRFGTARQPGKGPKGKPPPSAATGPLTRWRQRHGPRFGRPLIGLAWLNMLVALVTAGAFSDNVARSVAIAFAGVVSGLIGLAFGSWLRGGAEGTRFPFGLIGLAAGFAYFGFGAWMFSSG